MESNIKQLVDTLDTYIKDPTQSIVTRFPPEPNGYLHIGHAKAMFVNFTYAKEKNGICYMRFDDTNPSKEKQEYIDSILEDVVWLGHTPYKVTYTSDYFEQLYNLAKELIRIDKAYICELSQDVMQKQRYDGVESPYRNRATEESLKLFEEMASGKHPEGSMTLRLKCDMQSNNPNMRDLVAYRILYKEHPRTGDKYCIYPTYDYSHPLVDSLEKISHSLCSMEFQSRNELYTWIPNVLGIYSAQQIEYARLNITHTVLSKRKLIELVNDKIVDGWDDPRMPTIKGLRRRGYTAASITNFCSKIGLGLGTSGSIVDYNLLDECLRQDLDTKASRVLAVLNPLKVNIVNISDNILVDALDFPNLGNASSTRKINVSNVIYIEQDDFRLVDSSGYFRLAPNKIVRLKYLGLLCCTGFTQCSDGKVTEIFGELYPMDYKTNTKVKGTINWISEIDSSKIEIQQYSHLFPKKFNDDNNVDWKTQLNNDSTKSITALCDNGILKLKPYDKVQFERIGYFSIDPLSNNSHIIMNMITPLKEDKNK